MFLFPPFLTKIMWAQKGNLDFQKGLWFFATLSQNPLTFCARTVTWSPNTVHRFHMASSPRTKLLKYFGLNFYHKQNCQNPTTHPVAWESGQHAWEIKQSVNLRAGVASERVVGGASMNFSKSEKLWQQKNMDNARCLWRWRPNWRCLVQF